MIHRSEVSITIELSSQCLAFFSQLILCKNITTEPTLQQIYSIDG